MIRGRLHSPALYAASAAVIAMSLLTFALPCRALAQESTAAPVTTDAAEPSKPKTRGSARKRAAPGTCRGLENEIRVIVTNVAGDAGTITVDLHGDRPEDFLKKGQKLLRVRKRAVAGRVEICLSAPRPGTYAIGLYHDRNGNKRFDRNFLGLPVEPYGISNNPRIRFGPPSHEEAAFRVGPEGTALEIVLN